MALMQHLHKKHSEKEAVMLKVSLLYCTKNLPWDRRKFKLAGEWRK